MPAPQRFAFDFDPSYRLPALIFGVTPATAYVEVGSAEVRVRFGPWSLRSALTNITGVEETGDYAFLKTAGPAHLSLADKGVTFATNGRRGLCVSFADPVKALPGMKHPGMTVTVQDLGGLRDLLSR